MYDCFQHHRATEAFPDWVIRDCRLSFKKFVESVVANSKIVYSDLKYFKEYKDKTVLMIGGGPSTKKLEIESVERDFTWSCNHFFLNPKLKETKVDLAMLMGEVDLETEEFLAYREKYEPYLGFEVHDRWFGHEFDDYDKYFTMHTKFYGRIGVGARMLIFASALGCKKVIFTGFDGPEYIFDGNHAFEPGKTTLPGVFAKMKNSQISASWKIQSDYFWNYVQELYPNVEYRNIGGGVKYHEKIR